MLSDLISYRDTLELELNRVLNEESMKTIHKKIDFDKILNKLSETNSKIELLGVYMDSLNNEENNNND